jgi:hypothetical protein
MDCQLPKQFLRLVDSHDEDQLQALYHVVAQRLQLAQKAQAIAAMSRFHVLDRVSFVHNGKQYVSVQSPAVLRCVPNRLAERLHA